MRVLPTAVGAAGALALLAAGCGGDSSQNASSGSSAKATATPTRAGGKGGGGTGNALTVKETEYKIAPQDATVRVAKGGKVILEVTNAGKIAHALNIEEAAGDGKDVESGTISPGSSKTVTAAIKPGTYEWYCPIPGHKAAGMEGKITVKG